MMNSVMHVQSSIKDFYYKKHDHFYCCYLTPYRNLGELWPMFGAIKKYINFDTIVVPYDKIKFDPNYNKFSLDDHLEYASHSGMFVFIDKLNEHIHDEKDFDELFTNLKKHNLLQKCVVIDGTKNEYLFEKHGVPHFYFPGMIWFYLMNTKIPAYVAQPNNQFLCLNNYHKPHRLASIITLDQQKLLKRTAWSYRQPIDGDLQGMTKIIPNFNLGMLTMDIPKYLDQTPDKFVQSLNMEKLYGDAMATIVTETDYFFEHIVYASEKTYNAIFYGTVPILVSTPNSINVLREHSIDVYDDIIDHSYDEEVNPIKRFEKISETIEMVGSFRQYGQIRSILASRILRNQILINDATHWIKETEHYGEKFFMENKISI